MSATLDSISEVGYAATTTRRICEVAGVSQGAQAHYYPRRVDLIVAAARDLTFQTVWRLDMLGEKLPVSRRDRAEAVLDIIWDAFTSSTFSVFIRLWVAAADDPELYERLASVKAELGKSVHGLAMRLAGDLTDPPDSQRRLQLAVAAIRGLALTELFEPGQPRGQDAWPSVRAALVAQLLGVTTSDLGPANVA